jgi:hypothetical protein
VKHGVNDAKVNALIAKQAETKGRGTFSNGVDGSPHASSKKSLNIASDSAVVKPPPLSIKKEAKVFEVSKFAKSPSGAPPNYHFPG